LVRLRLTRETTAEALFETAARIEAAGMRAWFGDRARVRAADIPRPGGDALEALGADVGGETRPDVAQGVAAHPPAIGTGEVTAGAGPRTRDSIARVMRRTQSRFRYCFERELQRDPSFSTRITLSFAIQPEGSSGDVEVEADDPAALRAHPDFAPCLQTAMSRARFVADRAGGEMRVRYPLIFNAAN
jgi:hypothetical protein